MGLSKNQPIVCKITMRIIQLSRKTTDKIMFNDIQNNVAKVALRQSNESSLLEQIRSVPKHVSIALDNSCKDLKFSFAFHFFKLKTQYSSCNITENKK